MSQTTPTKHGFSIRLPNVRIDEPIGIPITLTAKILPNSDGETATLHWCVHPDDRPKFSLKQTAEQVAQQKAGAGEKAMEAVLRQQPHPDADKSEKSDKLPNWKFTTHLCLDVIPPGDSGSVVHRFTIESAADLSTYDAARTAAESVVKTYLSAENDMERLLLRLREKNKDIANEYGAAQQRLASLRRAAAHLEEELQKSKPPQEPAPTEQAQTTSAKQSESQAEEADPVERRLQHLLNRMHEARHTLSLLDKRINTTCEEVRTEIIKIRSEAARKSVEPTDEQIVMAARHGVSMPAEIAQSILCMELGPKMLDMAPSDEAVIHALRRLFATYVTR